MFRIGARWNRGVPDLLWLFGVPEVFRLVGVIRDLVFRLDGVPEVFRGAAGTPQRSWCLQKKSIQKSPGPTYVGMHVK